MTAPTLDALVAKWTARSKDAVKTLSMKAHFAARGNDWVVAQEMISCQEAIDTAALLATLESRANAADTARASAEAALADREQVAQFLWRLLDDIDTVSDMTKGDDGSYRAAVEKIQRRRFEVGSTDGYIVIFKKVAP